MRSALATVDSAVTLTPRERSANDFYCEPRWAVDALLDVERFDGLVWDPAAGRDNIPQACRARDIQAIGSDLVARGEATVYAPLDFLGAADAPRFPRPENIISNPPYAFAEAFIERALSLASRKVAMLLRLSFLEGQRRGEMFQRTPLARVWVFSSRVSMPPGDVAVEANGGAVAFAWFVWEHGHSGPPSLGWLRRKP
jgi:hypothetical protein